MFPKITVSQYLIEETANVPKDNCVLVSCSCLVKNGRKLNETLLTHVETGRVELFCILYWFNFVIVNRLFQ